MTDARQEAVEALVALGYSSTDALRAVRKVTDVEPTDVEGNLKAALKNFRFHKFFRKGCYREWKCIPVYKCKH